MAKTAEEKEQERIAKEAAEQELLKKQAEEMAKDTQDTVTGKELSKDTREDIYEKPIGFDDEEAGDLIIPRVKVIQALSPERKEKIADEGEILNSLTKQKLNGKTFIPIYMFHNNILWKSRDDGGGIACIAREGKIGIPTDGSPSLICSVCRANEFDNSKTGKEAQPKCTKYINFFGFFEDDGSPIILSFAKTNYADGKKMYSLAKLTMQNMFNFGYKLTEKKVIKNNNEWFIINPIPVGAVSDEHRKHGMALYNAFRDVQALKFDMDGEAVDADQAGPSMATQADISAAEY